jgi:glycyl-tRNA synthetase beta chain
MPDLLLELFSEEIPARMQAGAAKDLERLMIGALTDRGFLFEGIKAFAGPRRLTLAIAGLPAKQSDVREELKGPRTDAPPAALEGFLKKTGLTKDQLKTQTTPKGDVYMAVIERKGRETPHVLAEIIPDVMAKLPWPKSMRWKPGLAVRWVRPLHSILCTFDGELVAFSFAGVSSGLHTRGHRFLSEGKIEARRFDDYEQKLRAAHVILDAEERVAVIFEGIKQAAFVHGLEMIPDEGLLAEVSGLAEWPVVYVGTIQNEFMDVPAEILQTSMRTHQKYFSLRDPKTGKMANRFALVANMIAKDGGKEIIAGNERVLRARLSDAKFFWDEDRKHTLESRVEKLKGIVFHAKLGTQFERIERIAALAGELASVAGADVKLAQRAARLAKADLTTGVVGEFPELQGVMGRYYALHDKEDASVCDAIRDHYKPVGPSDAVPSGKVAIAVALADKLDALTGFFAVGEKPTGSGDPFALRRAALGILRIIDASKLQLELRGNDLLFNHLRRFKQFSEIEYKEAAPILDAITFDFLGNRLEVFLKDRGVSVGVVRAAFGRTHSGFNPADLISSVESLQVFLKSDAGANLLAGYKRAANILRIEEKKDGVIFGTLPWISPSAPTEERDLANALEKAEGKIRELVLEEKFTDAFKVMAGLRPPVDAFFEKVKVNDDDKQVRLSRLELLSRLRGTLHAVADFSAIEG